MSSEFLNWYVDSVLGLWPLFLVVLVLAAVVGFVRAWRDS